MNYQIDPPLSSKKSKAKKAVCISAGDDDENGNSDIAAKKKKRGDEGDGWTVIGRDKIASVLLNKGFGEWASIISESGK